MPELLVAVFVAGVGLALYAFDPRIWFVYAGLLAVAGIVVVVKG